MENNLFYRCKSCQIVFQMPGSKGRGHLSPIKMKTRCDGRIRLSVSISDRVVACPSCGVPFLFDGVCSLDESEFEGDKTESKLSSLGGIQSAASFPENLERGPSEVQFGRALGYRELINYSMSLSVRDFDRGNYLYQALHCFNDFREANPDYIFIDEDFSFIQRVIENPGVYGEAEILLVSELNRELGRFEEAKKILDENQFTFSAGRAEQLMQNIETKNREFFYFSEEDDDDFAWLWKARVYQEEVPVDCQYEGVDPPVFKIGNRDWWVKVLGMESHNWALIEKQEGLQTVVFFFQGSCEYDSSLDDDPLGPTRKRNRDAVIDQLEFQSVSEAIVGLKRNGFSRLKETPGPWMGSEPRGLFYDGREAGRGIYSDRGYWQKPAMTGS